MAQFKNFISTVFLLRDYCVNIPERIRMFKFLVSSDVKNLKVL